MKIEVLLVQFLVLAFTGAVWWLARRDLASRPAPPMPPVAPQAETQELEQLCATLEALVTDLAGRVEALERRTERRREGRGNPAPMPSPAGTVRPLVLSDVAAPPLPEPESASHVSLYALLDEGVTDPAEITRRTGLGRGEVDLILSLRARRAL